MENINITETAHEIKSFTGGYFRIGSKRGTGVMDHRGNVIIEPQWDDVVITPDDGKVEMFIRRHWMASWGTPQFTFDLLDTKGNIVHQYESGQCVGIREGAAVVKGVCGIHCLRDSRINPRMFVLHGPMDKESDYSGLFHDGRLRVLDKKGNSYFVDDWGGRKSKSFIEAGDFHQERAVVAVKWPISRNMRLYGIIDTEGKYVMWPSYDEIRPFKNYRARVQKKGRYGYIDRQGNERVLPIWDVAQDFDAEGLAFARRHCPVSANMIDRDGNQVVQLAMNCTEAKSYSEDLLPAKTEKLWGYADRDGKWAIEPQFEAAGDFVNGVAPVSKHGSWRFIDRGGEEVLSVNGWMKMADRGLAYTENAINDYGYRQK